MARSTKRDDELATRPRIKEKLTKVFAEIESGFVDQQERINDILNYWDLYNCVLNEKQFYNGNSQIYAPIVFNAIEARKTRFTNQIFPQSGRYIDVTTDDDEQPYATMSLAEHYVRRAKLRTQVVPALSVNGDVEGQYSIYAGWRTTKRFVVSRETRPVTVAALEIPELGDVTFIRRETIEEGCPFVEVLADADLLVLPITVDSIEEALEVGGSVTVRRRWTKARIKELIDEGEFEEEAGEAMLREMSKKEGAGYQDMRKKLADVAGIKQNNSGKYAIGFETWTKLKVDKEMRITRSYYGGNDRILGCKLNPYWCDKVPVISGPVKKLPGIFKGRSPIAGGVMYLQLLANDLVNMGADTAYFSTMPIVMTDPTTNPRTGTMTLGLGALWEVDPNTTKFASFPPMWEKAMELVSQIETKIFQSLGVNPAMIPQQTGYKQKRNQAEIANEQQVDILTTADAVTNIEEQILTPLIQRFIEYDHQFREDGILVRSFGEMGMRAIMEEVEPIQMDKRHEYRWFGVEAARNAAMMQQQIAAIGMLQKIPPQMLPNMKFDMTAPVAQIIENLFGARISPKIFRSLKDELAVDPELENRMMLDGFNMAVHAMDDDQKHLQAHQQIVEQDARGTVKAHIAKHMQQLQQKAQAAAMSQMQQQGQGGGGRGGRTQPGAQVKGPSLGKQPPGAIPRDQMPRAGAVQMPRKY